MIIHDAIATCAFELILELELTLYPFLKKSTHSLKAFVAVN